MLIELLVCKKKQRECYACGSQFSHYNKWYHNGGIGFLCKICYQRHFCAPAKNKHSPDELLVIRQKRRERTCYACGTNQSYSKYKNGGGSEQWHLNRGTDFALCHSCFSHLYPSKRKPYDGKKSAADRQMFLTENRNRERRRRFIVRERIFHILGHVCVRCGEFDKRVLQFDHINGGGAKELTSVHPMTVYQYYARNPDAAKKKLQVLCASCNRRKVFENDELFYKGKKSNMPL